MNFERMEQRCGDFEFLGKGILQGYKLVFNKTGIDGTGRGNIIESEDDCVEGLVYNLTKEQQENLDRYERGYEKIEVLVDFNKKKIKARAYKALKFLERPELKPNKEYLETLLTAKKYLSEEYYNNLEKVETID